MKAIKYIIHASLAVAVALALKYALLFCYSAYKLSSSLSPEARAQAAAVVPDPNRPIMYKAWDWIIGS